MLLKTRKKSSQKLLVIGSILFFQYCQRAQILDIFHRNLPTCNFSIMTLAVILALIRLLKVWVVRFCCCWIMCEVMFERDCNFGCTIVLTMSDVTMDRFFYKIDWLISKIDILDFQILNWKSNFILEMAKTISKILEILDLFRKVTNMAIYCPISKL